MIESFTSNNFEYKKISAEEQKQRGILGRLVGIIADTKSPTRNGRKYSEQLWENVFNDPIMQEKIKNGVLFGELGHPEDRQEIDMEKIAVCMRDAPKKGKDGKLYGVLDILDTPNGRILKTLCDYGSVVAVSSRGSGDIITDSNGDEAVDPDTYECVGFDIVLIPGVEKARLQYVTESLDTNTVNMKRALCESLEKATDEERKVMTETLKELNIKLDEEKKEEVPEEEVEETTVETEEEEVSAPEEESSEPEEKTIDDVASDLTQDEVEAISGYDKAIAEIESMEVLEKEAVIELLKHIKAEEEEHIEEVEAAVKVAKGELSPEEIEEPEVEENESNPEEGEDKEEESEQPDETNPEEAVDDGTEELIKGLQESLKAKSDLEAEVKSLHEELAVANGKVDKLAEECDSYKTATVRLATKAAESKELAKKVSSLEESLKAKEAIIEEKTSEIEAQNSKIARLVEGKKKTVSETKSLNESVSAKETTIKELNESIAALKSSHEKEIQALNEKLIESENSASSKAEALKGDLAKVTNLKESYKKLANKTISKYIDCKALMLGVSPKEITNKLSESYTLEDVDKVCADLQAYQINMAKLPIGLVNKGSIKIKVNESVGKSTKKSDFEDDDVDEALLKMAGFNY